MSKVSKRLPEPYRFVADECLAQRLPLELRANGFDIVPFANVFPRGTLDPDWLPVLGRTGLILLSKDGQLSVRSNEIDALLLHGIAAFLLGRGDLPGDQMAEAFIKAKRAMFQLLAEIDAPFVASVTRTGQVQLRVDATGARQRRKPKPPRAP